MARRWPAYKLWIENLNKGSPIYDAGKFIGINALGKKIKRVNIIANVIDKFEAENFSILTIDDSTGIIEVRDFDNGFKEIKIGDVILVIGSLRNFNEKTYIAREIIKKVHPLWLIARKLELEKIFKIKHEEIDDNNKNKNQHDKNWDENSERYNEGDLINEVGYEKISDIDEVNSEKENFEGSNKKDIEKNNIEIENKVFELIKKNEVEKGEVNVEDIYIELSFPMEKIKEAINNLIDKAKIYEPRPGILKTF